MIKKYVLSSMFVLLYKTESFCNKIKFASLIWWKTWNAIMGSHPGSVTYKIHHQRVESNFGYMYPLISRRYHTYNNPYLQLVYESFVAQNEKAVNVIDVGAAIGDTALLVLKNCDFAVNQILCIEGDMEFFNYLQKNLAEFDKTIVINQLLSNKLDAQINELVRIHPGTSSAIGLKKIDTKTLDSVLENFVNFHVDVIKIDVDGLDGLILEGSTRTILKYEPAIIFEWHPIMLDKTGNNFESPFELLTNLNYNQFLWFDKFGNFNHCDNFNLNNLKFWNQICMQNKLMDDNHFDIIALHENSKIDKLSLSEGIFARQKISKY